MLLVVAYDIANDRRRIKLHTLLLGFGTPVQESVFECEVSERQKRALQRRVMRVIRPEVDQVRYYLLCADCALRTEDGDGQRREPGPDIYVV